MNPVANALSSGFTAQQILTFLMQQFPQHSSKIKKAIAKGFTAENIIKHLEGKSQPFQDTSSMTEHERTRAGDIQERRNIDKTVLGAGALAAGTVLSPFASQAVGRVLARALPHTLGQHVPSPQNAQTGINPSAGIALSPNPHIPPVPPIQPTPQQTPQTLQATSLQQPQQPPVNQTPVNQFPENITQPTDIQQPKQLGLQTTQEKRINTLKGFKNKKASAIQRELERVENEYGEIDPNESAHGLAKKAQIPYEKANELIQAKRDAELLEEPKPIKEITKGSLTASPMGMGEVKELRNGSALIDVDGKIHKVSEEDLIESPLPQKELADLYDDLIGGIEKTTGQQVSRNVDWAGYDPKTNELAYKPHGSDKLYAYDNISPEDIEVLTGFLTQRKSTGDNYIGAWEKGSTSPIGAAMYQLIQKLQKERGGKGNEYKNRYDTIYDSLESAKKAAKKRHAERKKEAKKSRAR